MKLTELTVYLDELFANSRGAGLSKAVNGLQVENSKAK